MTECQAQHVGDHIGVFLCGSPIIGQELARQSGNTQEKRQENRWNVVDVSHCSHTLSLKYDTDMSTYRSLEIDIQLNLRNLTYAYHAHLYIYIYIYII